MQSRKKIRGGENSKNDSAFCSKVKKVNRPRLRLKAQIKNLESPGSLEMSGDEEVGRNMKAIPSDEEGPTVSQHAHT